MFEFKPDYVVLPGETIKDILDSKKQTIADLAKATDLTLDYLVDVIEGRSPITEDLAKKLESFLGSPAKFWLKRQDNYDSDRYRLFWETVRVKPNLFAHLTDDQLEALECLFESLDCNIMPSTEDKSLYENIDFLLEQAKNEFSIRFFPNENKENPG